MVKCLEFTKLPRNRLELALTPDGREKLREALLDDPEQLPGRTMAELMEWHLCNGWDILGPDEIGALTACELILSDDVKRRKDGTVAHCGNVYWHPDYMVECAADVLRECGRIVLQGQGR